MYSKRTLEIKRILDDLNKTDFYPHGTNNLDLLRMAVEIYNNDRLVEAIKGQAK